MKRNRYLRFKIKKRVSVTEESPTGRNTNFRDNETDEDLTLRKFIDTFNKYCRKYHIRNIGGVKTPVSNPNGKKDDNLG